MDRQQIGLKLMLDALGLPPRLDTFSDRLIVQKAIYLCQAAGVQLGYSFHWYRRGPYSPSLTRDAFAVVAELRQGVDDSEGWKLDETSLARLQRLKPLLNLADSEKLATQLELLASVHFLLQSPAGRGKTKELRAILQQYGKNFSDNQIQHAVEQLQQHDLCAGSSSK